MDAIRGWWVEARGRAAVEKLTSHGFDAQFLWKKEEAAGEILKHVLPDVTVGGGGSLTIRELGLLEKIEARGNPVYDHWKTGLSKEAVLGIRKSQLTCGLFLSGVNAVTLNGELINSDLFGNRINAGNFGPGKVVLVAGTNKIVEDVQEGIARIKNVAAPLNARRLNLDVPCATLGKCVDCNSPNRICRVIMIHERKPPCTDIHVIIVGEELGY